MNRSVAFRAGILFTILAALFAATGASSQAAVAYVLFAISASLCFLTMGYALSRAIAAPVPVRVRRRR